MAMTAQQLDSEGYIVDPMQWDEALAETIARQENIELSATHWDVIRFMRRYYEEHLVAPDARFAIKHLRAEFGNEARNKLFDLFPYGYVKQACRIAGMKRPRAWSTG
jgi:TusE/DsrC/DsvC family sulfur relay protein